MDRKLAAILAADVVGYSALMERDERGTHERLTAGRKELFEPEIARHHGRVFKLMGDGLLAEFGSVVDAVECAVSLQRGLAERNAHVPEDQRVLLRIGINLGEVIVDGEDRFGEGVNIASRLEQLAEPGGICVSGKVAKEVEKKLAFGFEPMGEQKVKNIAEPVPAFRVNLDGAPSRRVPLAPKRSWAWAAAVAAVLLLAGGAWFASRSPTPEAVVESGPAVVDSKPSLVVLPFDNLSDDKEQGYLADGITEDLTTELARVPGLFVISRNAAFAYKDKPTPPAQIAKALGVRYILEGSTRRAGEEMRLNAQLIDAETGGHVWAERFDGKWADVFALQDKVVGSIAGALKLRLASSFGKTDMAGGTGNPAAYNAYLKGLELYLRNDLPEEFAEAATHFRQALALDPNFGAAAAYLAWIHGDADVQRVKALGLSWDDIESKIHEYLDAAAKNPSAPYYQFVAELLVRERKSDEAIAILHKAVALDPSHPWNYEGLSAALIFNGQPKDGSAYLETAMRVDPGWNDWRRYLAGHAAFGQGRFEDAAAILEEIDVGASFPWAKFHGLQVLMSAYAHLARDADSAAAMAKFKTVLMEMDDAGYSRLRAQFYFVYKNEGDIARLLDGLAKAGLPEFPPDAGALPNDRLTEAEIRSLFFGHEVLGRLTKPELAEFKAITSADGSTSATTGSWSRKGSRWTQAGCMCVAYPIDLTTCFAVFRNPLGTFERKNEYVSIGHRNRYEYSVVK